MTLRSSPATAKSQRRMRPGSAYRLQFNRSFRFMDAIQHRSLPADGSDQVPSTLRQYLQHAPAACTATTLPTTTGSIRRLAPKKSCGNCSASCSAAAWGCCWMSFQTTWASATAAICGGCDVLQNGRTSEYANFFDIDWNPLKPELRNRVLLPILGNQYGEELEAGHIVLGYGWPGLPRAVLRQTAPHRPADHSADASRFSRYRECSFVHRVCRRTSAATLPGCWPRSPTCRRTRLG